MLNNNDILNELNDLSPALVPLQKVNVFTVPDHYFRDFAGSVLPVILSENAVLPADVQNIMNVPEGYFDSLADNILSKIKMLQPVSAAEEIKELSPALAATGNDNVFTVPSRYFADLPEIIINSVKPAKVVRMRTVGSFAKYAAAAVITGILGLSLFSAFNKTNTTPKDTVAIASITDDPKNTINFDKALEGVSDEEIVGYLENNGQDVKAALVAAATDNIDLPSQDEYIFNENALDNLLEELNINDYSN